MNSVYGNISIHEYKAGLPQVAKQEEKIFFEKPYAVKLVRIPPPNFERIWEFKFSL